MNAVRSIMDRGAPSFKHTDIVRAVRAARAAGLSVVRTEIHPDGRIVLHHQLAIDVSTEREETYEEWKARTGNGVTVTATPFAAPADVPAHPSLKLDPNTIPLPEVFTPSTLAAHWGCSSAKIRRLVRSGDLPGFMLGSRLLRIRAQEVLAYEAKIGAATSEPGASAPAPEKRARAQRLDVRRPGGR